MDILKHIIFCLCNLLHVLTCQVQNSKLDLYLACLTFTVLQTFADFQKCDENQYRCDNKQCIPSGKRCDSQPDCLDKSDEEKCG
jgi:hypothetical protein